MHVYYYDYDVLINFVLQISVNLQKCVIFVTNA